MITREQINRSRKHEKGYPEDEAELRTDVEEHTRAEKAHVTVETSFADSRRYWCLVEL